ncbi:MAG: histidine triad nucleotide-binding protein [Acidimicrobiia bacterium]|nr:histidine triad nucleotide-binding protein [Acidimicrobiia bacterium]
MADCLFCKIAVGSIPSERVEETERVLAFRDINPAAPTHVLLIPKEHVADSAAQIRSEHGEMLAELFELAARIAEDEHLADGWRLVTNVGAGAGQSVFHLHMHLLGGRPFGWPPG